MLAHVVIILPDDENHVCYIISSARLCKSDHKTVCTCTLKKHSKNVSCKHNSIFFLFKKTHKKRKLGVGLNFDQNWKNIVVACMKEKEARFLTSASHCKQ